MVLLETACLQQSPQGRKIEIEAWFVLLMLLLKSAFNEGGIHFSRVTVSTGYVQQ